MMNMQTLYIMVKWLQKNFIDKIGEKKTLMFFIAMIKIQFMIPSFGKITNQTKLNKTK